MTENSENNKNEKKISKQIKKGRIPTRKRGTVWQRRKETNEWGKGRLHESARKRG